MLSLSWLVQICSIRVTGVWTRGRRCRRQPGRRGPSSSCYFHLCPEPQCCPILPSSSDSHLCPLSSTEKESERNVISETGCLFNHPDSAILSLTKSGYFPCPGWIKRKIGQSMGRRLLISLLYHWAFTCFQVMYSFYTLQEKQETGVPHTNHVSKMCWQTKSLLNTLGSLNIF